MRVALVGCGRWGRHILRDLLILGCEVPVVARSDESIERAQSSGAHAIVGAIDGLAGVDGVVVATPTSTHATVVEQALSLGVPVFVEKPLADDPAAARRLATTAPGRLFVMDKWRYHPGVLEIAAIAREQRLGIVRMLRTVRLGWGSAHDDVDSVWVLAPHDLAIALEILGEVPAPLAASGECARGRLEGLTGLLRAGDVQHVLEASSRSPVRERRVELRCEGGVAVLGGGWDEHVTVYRDTGAPEPVAERVEVEGELPLLAELRAFVAHLGGGPPPHSSVGEGAEIVETIATLRALAGG